MESRFTAFLLPILLVLGLLYFLKPPDDGDKKQDPNANSNKERSNEEQRGAAPRPQPEQEPTTEGSQQPVTQLFGTRDREQGGFKITFARRGAGIRDVTLNDVYMTPEARALKEKDDKHYYSIVGEYSATEQLRGMVLESRGRERFKRDIEAEVWQVEQGKNRVRFYLEMEGGLTLEKVYRYQEGRRDLEFEVNLKSKPERTGKLPSEYLLWLRGVQVWNPKEDQVLRNPAVVIARTLQNGLPVVKAVRPANERGLVGLVSTSTHTFDFAGSTNRFFGAFLYSEDESTRAAVSGVSYYLQPEQEFVLQSNGATSTIGPFGTPVPYYKLRLNVPEPGQTQSLKFRLYLGPKSTKVFAENPDTAAEYERFDAIMDFDLDPPCCIPIPGVDHLAAGLVWLLRFFQSIVGNWGVAIFLLTIVVRGVLFPVNFRMQKTMREFGQKMAVLKPQIEALQSKYKNDPKQLQQEMMKFHREHKLMSQPLKGCLPMFLTMPIWLGLFTALRVMYDLRQQPFFGYIQDLSLPDRMFQIPVPYIEYFNLLPLLMCALWVMLYRQTPMPKDPQQAQMTKMMRLMPYLFLVLLYHYAAALMIYMITSSLWGLVESRIVKKVLGPVTPEAAQAGTTMPMM